MTKTATSLLLLALAGPAFAEHANDLGPKGATGVPVRMLVRYVLDRAGSK